MYQSYRKTVWVQKELSRTLYTAWPFAPAIAATAVRPRVMSRPTTAISGPVAGKCLRGRPGPLCRGGQLCYRGVGAFDDARYDAALRRDAGGLSGGERVENAAASRMDQLVPRMVTASPARSR